MVNTSVKTDLLGVLTSTKKIVEESLKVTVNEEKTAELARKVKAMIDAGLPTREEEFNTFGSYEKDVQSVF